MTREERLKKKAKYKGPRYEIPRGDVGRLCESCGQQLHFIKTKTGKLMPVEYDGMPHWGFCEEPERFSGKGKRA